MPDITLSQLFTNIANAIRTKKGTNALIAPTSFASEISALSLPMPSLNMTSFINATNVTTSDRICIMWGMIFTGESGTVNFTNGTIEFCYYDNINYSRDDPYVRITNNSTSVTTYYWRDDLLSSYLQVPFNLGNYVSHSCSHTNNGSRELDAALMLLRLS